jgi:hypothetical protein
MTTAAQGSDTQRQLAAAFVAFEETLRAALTTEARSAVEAAIARLKVNEGPFRVLDIEVDLVIRSMTLEAGGRPPAKPRAARAPAGRSRRPSASRGRPPGAIRTAIVGAFADSTTPLSVDTVRDQLGKRGLDASSDNLHQHLRRLVKSGELERAGRGIYRRTSAASGR